jgi:hypothetical protein
LRLPTKRARRASAPALRKPRSRRGTRRSLGQARMWYHTRAMYKELTR